MNLQNNFPKETNELGTSLFNTIGQGIESFRDGAQISDLTDFIDEGLSWQNAIQGLTGNIKKEAQAVTAEVIEQMFVPYNARLVGSGLNPLMAGAIVTNAKGIYYTYAAIVQSGQDLVQPANAIEA